MARNVSMATRKDIVGLVVAVLKKFANIDLTHKPREIRRLAEQIVAVGLSVESYGKFEQGMDEYFIEYFNKTRPA